MSTVARWQTYWEDKSLAGFRYEDQDHYERCASELKVLFHHIAPASVLEIGCGNGALYEYLGFDQCDYLGLDFSQSMLNAFHDHFPRVNLLCADGASYLEDRKYDLIFSNGVLQHFDKSMLRQHFANARSMMQSTSLFVCASMPWHALWYRFLTGELSGETAPSPLRGIVLRTMRVFKQDGMGFWYKLSDFKRLAEDAGMSIAFYGSIYYPYRFHAVLALK